MNSAATRRVPNEGVICEIWMKYIYFLGTKVNSISELTTNTKPVIVN